jgi:hypothetical protein
MASLTNTKIKNTYVSLLKVADNGQLDAALQDITDGAGNVTGSTTKYRRRFSSFRNGIFSGL